MKTYFVVTKQKFPEWADSLLYGTSRPITTLLCLSGDSATVVIEDTLYDDLINHASFVQIYVTMAHVCPVAKAFLYCGKWFVSESEVSPFLMLLSEMKEK